MANDQQFWARYAGELTDEDRAALEDRPGFKLYANGVEVSDAYFAGAGEPAPEFTVYQVVRLTAVSPEDAHRLIVGALGREPEGLSIEPGKSEA